MNRLPSRFTASILALVSIALMGCRAMDVYDIDGRHFQNENRAFYAPEKEADVTLISHAYRWASDNLTGSCSQITRDALNEALPTLRHKFDIPRYPIDTIYVETAGLFPTDSSDLTDDGVSLLAQVTKRLSRYPEVLHIAVEGHTDKRASVAYNDALSERRAREVEKRLLAVFPKTNMRKLATGEHRLLNDGDSPEQLTPNRRVSIRAIVVQSKDDGVREHKRASAIDTLCHTKFGPDLVAQNRDSIIQLKTRIDRSTQPVYEIRPPLSAGDRLRVLVPEGDEISGVYEVGLNGQLEFPYIGFVQAQGLTTRKLEQLLHDRLIDAKIFNPHMLRISINVQEWAPVDVLVSGATFNPGRVTVNRQKAEDRTLQHNHLSGDFAKDRFLTAALYSAGGIRPDADLKNVQLIRNGNVEIVDLRGMFDGHLTKDTPLAAGDQVVVPSVGYFQGELVKVSQITPPGIRIFISNLTIPASNNSLSAVNSKSTSMPYGTRFLQAMVTGNCVGGTQLTNASRRVVLISRNPITGRTEVVERSVQQLVSDPERDDVNPYLMPNDAVACYDSGVTNFRDVTRTLSDFLSPVLDIKNLY